MPIDFHLLKQMPSLNLYPEVDSRLYGRHLEKSIQRHNYGAFFPFTTKFGSQMQNEMLMTTFTLKIETGSRIPIWRPSVL